MQGDNRILKNGLMNIRDQLNYRNGYNKINREERNIAAILYHLLLTGDNLRRFLDLIGCTYPVVADEWAIYFEYAFLRDLWNNITQGNEFKRRLILDLLQPINRAELEHLSIQDFNAFFKTGFNRSKSRASVDTIESPSNWSVEACSSNIADNEELRKVCEFKWCFNVKPDIVIHTSHNTAVCIEAKMESTEGKYPVGTERKILKERGIEPIGQLFIQEKLMKELLGIQTELRVIAKNTDNGNNRKVFTWRQVFNSLDTSSCPNFIIEWLRNPEFSN